MRISKSIRLIVILCGLLVGFAPTLRAQTNLLNDGSFELGSPNTYWNEGSTNFGFVICNTGTCGNVYTRTGSHSLWFGGISALEIGFAEQTVTIPAGGAELRFWIGNPVSSGSGLDFIQVQVDDIPVYTLYEGNSVYSTYKEVVINLNGKADGGSHKIEFYSESYGAGSSNFFIDDVTLVNIPPAVPIKTWSILLAFLLIGVLVIIKVRKANSVVNL